MEARNKWKNLDIGNLILLHAGLPHDWRLRHDVQPKQDVFLKVRPLDMDKLYYSANRKKGTEAIMIFHF